MKTYVVLNDIQIPFQDPRLLNLTSGYKAKGPIITFIKWLKPDGVVLNGDITDCFSISDFRKDPMTHADLDVEIAQSGRLMAALSHIKEKVWLGGNHEDRVRRIIWDKAPKLGVVPGLDFPGIFRLSKYGFTWHDYGEKIWLGKLAVTHGNSVSQIGCMTARKHFDRSGVSVLIGHSHRLGMYYRTNWDGPHVAVENGCLCRLDPDWCQDPDWQQGFSVVKVWHKKLFHITQIPIMPNGAFMYGNDLFGGA